MTKLKIRQYWTKQTNRPWYVVRFGHANNQYFTCAERDLWRTIKEAFKCKQFLNDMTKKYA